MEQILNIQIADLIDSPFQGRLYSTTDTLVGRDKSLIEELELSISQNGLLQPILVRHAPNINGKYEIIDGHRRVIAIKRLANTHIQAIVKELNDKQAQLQSIIANLQRKNLSAVENAIAFEKSLKQGLFNSKAQLSRAIGKDETYVGDLLNLLKMDKRVVNDLIQNKSLNDARLLRTIRNAHPVSEKQETSDEQFQLYNTTIENKFSRKQLYNYLETQKAEKIIDDNELDIDKQDLDDVALRQELLQKYKLSRVKRKISSRTIKAHFDLTGLDADTKQDLKAKIDIWLNEIDEKINKLKF